MDKASVLKKPRLAESEAVEEFLSDVRKLGEHLTCPVCKSLFRDARWTPCLHLICSSCCDTLLSGVASAKCPSCRQTFTTTQLRPSGTFTRLAEFFGSFQNRDASQAVAGSQVYGFSQLAKDMLDIELENARRGQLSFTPVVAHDEPVRIPISMPTAVNNTVETKPESARTVSDRSLDVADRRTPNVPRFSLDTPQSNLKLSGTETPSFSAHPQFRQDSDASFTEPTPFRLLTTTTTPPTVKLGEHVGLAFDQNDTTPDLQVTTKTPPTIKLIDAPQGSASVSEPPPIDQIVRTTEIVVPVMPTPATRPSLPLKKGTVVTVARRMGPGEYKPGGVAKVLKVNEDGTVDVHYPVECSREKRVSLEFIKLGIDTSASTLFYKTEHPSTDEAAPISASKRSRLERDTTRQLTFSSAGSPPHTKEIVIAITGDFSEKVKSRFRKEIKGLSGTTVDSPTEDDWRKISHLVTSVQKGRQGTMVASKRSVKFLRAMTLGLWIVSADWLAQCKVHGSWVDCAAFEVSSDVMADQQELTCGGPMRAREALMKMHSTGDERNLLFNRIFFAFVGGFDEVPDPVELARACGGRVFEDRIQGWTEFDLVKYNKECPDGMRTAIVCQNKESHPKERKARKLAEVKLAKDENCQMITMQWFLNSLSTYTVLDTLPYRVHFE